MKLPTITLAKFSSKGVFTMTKMTDDVTIGCSHPPRGVNVILLVRMCCLLHLLPSFHYISLWFLVQIWAKVFCINEHADWILLASFMSTEHMREIQCQA